MDKSGENPAQALCSPGGVSQPTSCFSVLRKGGLAFCFSFMAVLGSFGDRRFLFCPTI